MSDYGVLIFFSLIGGFFSLLGGLFLLSRKNFADFLAKYGTPFAAGALLAAVFLDLLPGGLEEDNAEMVFLAALIGILLFFIAERFLRWFHHHHEDEAEHRDPSVNLIVAGDTLHNALDGVAIASAFLISIPTGIVTTIAVAAHEIPQEIADFGLLLSKGVRRSRVLLLNIVSALATTVAAVMTYALGSDDKLPVGLLLGLSAGFLLYIALSDIIPTIHARTDASRLLHLQTLVLVIGVGVVGLAVNLAHSYIDVTHERSKDSHNEKTDEHYKVQKHHKNDTGH